MFIRLLFGGMILVCNPYSFPVDDSICNGFRTYVANPPRVLCVRRCSISVKPSSMGAAAPSEIHVSYRHSMSTCSYSKRSNIFI